MSKHVAVLMGGWSNERPVSLSSGNGCAAGLEQAGYRVTRVDVGRDVAEVLARLKPDVAFNALHGPFGEDGCIQGILEILAIPYTHSGVLASALAMNKPKAKDVMKAAGIPVAESILANRFDAAKAHVMAPPYVVKPPNEGSSFGVLIVKEDARHPPQQLFADDWPHGDIVMIEKYVGGRELTCAVRGNEALDVIDIITEDRFYDYEAKYLPGRLAPRPSGETFTRYLPKCTDARATGSSGFGVPRRESCRLPVRRPPGRNGATHLSGSQHAARHDAHVVGAGDGRLSGHEFPGLGELDGGGRIVQPLSEEPLAEEIEGAPAKFSLTRGLVLPRFLRRPARTVERLNFKLPHHPGLKALAVFCLSTAIAGTVMGDHVDARCVSAVTAWSGLAIDEVKITGQSETSELDVLDRLAIGPHPSLVTFDVDGARERVEALPWVRHATIRKLYPDALQVVVSERTPFAIWQHDGKASLIDRDGRAITDDIGDRYMTLPRVAGAGANMHAVEFVDLVQAFPELSKRIRAGVLVAGRRWNLVLENGVEVLLPEKDPASAIVAVVAIDAQSQILSRDVAAVDLRLNDRLIVRLTENGEVARETVLQEREKLAKKKGANT